ncbi:MAG: hypothetical protein J6D61_00345 [Clostridia bacterium]|nr:hypothetical protein [Clostridia bacterium]
MGKYENKSVKPQFWGRHRKRLWITVALELSVLLALVIGLAVILTGNPLKGSWYDAEGMVYKFSPNGKGLMVLEDDLARFRYDIKGDTLYIDFDSDEHEDRTYEFSVRKDTLYLDGGQWVYVRKSK